MNFVRSGRRQEARSSSCAGIESELPNVGCYPGAKTPYIKSALNCQITAVDTQLDRLVHALCLPALRLGLPFGHRQAGGLAEDKAEIVEGIAA